MLQVVSVTFQELRLEQNGKDDCYDSITLYNGYSTSSELLGKRYCTRPVSPIKSTGSFLLIVFMSDYSNHGGRFSLNWAFVSKDSHGWLHHKLLMSIAI